MLIWISDKLADTESDDFTYFDYANQILKHNLRERVRNSWMQEDGQDSVLKAEKKMYAALAKFKEDVESTNSIRKAEKELRDAHAKSQSTSGATVGPPRSNVVSTKTQTCTPQEKRSTTSQKNPEKESSSSWGIFHLLFLVFGLPILKVIVAYWQKSMMVKVKPSGCLRIC